jgi:hypothetical protein
VTLDERLRARLAIVADGLIPESEGMPAPSVVGVGREQLDAVVASRPDLAGGLRRALEAAGDVQDPIAWLAALDLADPEAHEALVVAVVAGYYLHPEVQRRLGYPGQVAQEVSVAGLPEYVNEGLLERVYERGPIYRPTPAP